MKNKVAIADLKPHTNGSKRFRQKRQIIKLLYDRGETTIPEFSKLIGISIPTTTALINELIENGAISTKGIAVTKRGRKPAIFELVDSYQYVVCCEMNRFQSKMALFNCHNAMVSDIKIVDTYYDDPMMIEKLIEGIGSLISESKIANEKVAGFGLAMPGLVNAKEGYNQTIQSDRLKGVRKLLQLKLQKFVYVDNDARMQAYGEYMFGKARHHSNALVINWDWGLGLGLIFNGQLYSGSTGFAGELSHIKMQEEGNLCICGKRGCFETIASAGTLLNLSKESIANNVISQLTAKFRDHSGALTPADVIAAARSGDEFSISVLNKIGLAMGKGLAILIQLLNPEIIVFQGSISKANQFVLNPVQQSLNKYCIETLYAGVTIEISDLEEQAGLLGTAAMLFQTMLNEPIPPLLSGWKKQTIPTQ
jgi:N-acetylglucosamine repressor